MNAIPIEKSSPSSHFRSIELSVEIAEMARQLIKLLEKASQFQQQ